MKIRDFFRKLRAGDFGLFETYWFYGIGVGVIANIISSFISSELGFGIFGIVYSLYGSQVAFGIWRAAKKYKGLKTLAVISQIIAVLSFVSIFILISLSALSLYSWIGSLGYGTLIYAVN